MPASFFDRMTILGEKFPVLGNELILPSIKRIGCYILWQNREISFFIFKKKYNFYRGLKVFFYLLKTLSWKKEN